MKRLRSTAFATIWAVTHCSQIWCQTQDSSRLTIEVPSTVVLGETIYPTVVASGMQDEAADSRRFYFSGCSDDVRPSLLRLEWTSDKQYGVTSSPLKPAKSGVFSLTASCQSGAGKVASTRVELLVYPGPLIALNAPATSRVGNAIDIRVTASAGTYPLAGVEIACSWDAGASGWTEVSANGTPAGRIVTQVESIPIKRSGTLSLRAVCWDVYSNESHIEIVRVEVAPTLDRKDGS